MKLVKYFKSSKPEVTSVFNRVTIPNFDEFTQTFQVASRNFNQVADYYIQDAVIENCMTDLLINFSKFVSKR